MTHNPYKDLPPTAFWRSGVADLNALEIGGIYSRRFVIDKDEPIAAAGSCFAQHIAREFKRREFNFLDLEPAPPLLRSPQEYGYEMYSARYGNIYSARQFLQLLRRAYSTFRPKEAIWKDGERFIDPFRPSIEPNGFSSESDLIASRDFHLARVRELFETAQVFVFTFGLTEAWTSREDGAVFPSCPGTVAGTFDDDRHQFQNFGFTEILTDIEELLAAVRSINPMIRFLFTVSPVPLTATASGEHVLPATVYSKSVLRAVCGELLRRYEFVDYFPSYELVASHPMRAMFFDPNLRTVSARGVQHVMSAFFGATPSVETAAPHEARHPDDVFCDEASLEKYAQ
jgi:hypothetical protein